MDKTAKQSKNKIRENHGSKGEMAIDVTLLSHTVKHSQTFSHFHVFMQAFLYT